MSKSIQHSPRDIDSTTTSQAEFSFNTQIDRKGKESKRKFIPALILFNFQI